MGLDIDVEDPRAVAAAEAIRKGDTAALGRLLKAHPELATARFGPPGQGCRTALHVACDWPGNYPNGPETVALLVQAGADVNARFIGSHSETPLHWAASNDDVMMLDALLDHGADIEADGAVIAGGTPLDDAVAFAQWTTARRLVGRGARVGLFNAAALGMVDRVRELTTAGNQADLNAAFWAACHGGSRDTAGYLLQLGADHSWVAPWDGHTPLEAARRNDFHDLAAWLQEGAS